MATMNLKVRLIRNRKKYLYRLIDAIGLLSHIISGDFIGPCPTASADLSELTPPTLPMITIYISKILEDFTVCPDLLERLLPHISTIHFEIAAGLYLAHMGDEAEGDTSQTSSSHGIQSKLFLRNLLSFLLRPFSEDTVVMGGTGGLELERDMVFLLIKPVEDFFVIQSRYLLIF
jgi:hypothetical protein